MLPTLDHVLQLEEAIHVALPPRQAFEVAADPANMPLWNPAVRESALIGELGLGARVIQEIELLGRGFEAEYEVTSYRPGREVRFTSVVGPVTIEAAMRFERDAGGTLVRWTVAGDCRGFLRATEGLLARAGRRELRACLENLKHLLEASVAA